MSFEKKYLKYKKKYSDLIKLQIEQRYKTSLNLEGGSHLVAAENKKRILILSSHQNNMRGMIYNLLFNNNMLENNITKWKDKNNKHNITNSEVLTQFRFDNYGTLKIEKKDSTNIGIQIIGDDKSNFRDFFNNHELILPMNKFPNNLIVYIVGHGEAINNNTIMIEELAKINLPTLKGESDSVESESGSAASGISNTKIGGKKL